LKDRNLLFMGREKLHPKKKRPSSLSNKMFIETNGIGKGAQGLIYGASEKKRKKEKKPAKKKEDPGFISFHGNIPLLVRRGRVAGKKEKKRDY